MRCTRASVANMRQILTSCQVFCTEVQDAEECDTVADNSALSASS